MPDLFTTTIKNSLPQELTKTIKETLLGFNRRIRNAIKDEIPEVLNTSVLKPMYKEFNALNKLKTQRFVILDKSLRKSVCKTVSKSVYKNMLHSSVKVPKDILVFNAKHLQTKVDMTSADLHELVRLVSRVANLMDTITPSANVATEGENDLGASQYYPIPHPEMADKGKGIAQTSDDDVLKQILPFIEEGGSALSLSSLQHFRAQEQDLAEIKAQRIKHLNKMRDEYMQCINFRDDPLPITNFKDKISKSSKIATMQVTRNKQPLNYKIFDDFKLKMLGFSEWLELHALSYKNKDASNDLLLKNLQAKFKKRRVEVMKEVFLKDDIVVDGMHKNLIDPEGVIGSIG
ncbi:hypothetical protein Tco_0822016 [Tanacetum coccineum]|uniref:Uncharacterized protein n=1 Tax=Tanacetum coccineum TaxID=301880 RepID=A0ABQ5AGW1_9ASTR